MSTKSWKNTGKCKESVCSAGTTDRSQTPLSLATRDGSVTRGHMPAAQIALLPQIWPRLCFVGQGTVIHGHKGRRGVSLFHCLSIRTGALCLGDHMFLCPHHHHRRSRTQDTTHSVFSRSTKLTGLDTVALAGAFQLAQFFCLEFDGEDIQFSSKSCCTI